jgi:hypothetical protein
MALLLHTKVSKNWHQIRTEHGLFFGQSLEEATGKAKHYAREKTLADAERGHLPLLPQQQKLARCLLLREVCAGRLLRRVQSGC